MTFKVSLDSSIVISHLAGDVHKDEVLAAIERLETLEAELFLSGLSLITIRFERNNQPSAFSHQLSAVSKTAISNQLSAVSKTAISYQQSAIEKRTGICKDSK